jgi:hypothetical protein
MARQVFRWYFELEDGRIQTNEGSRFDPRVLDYRVDVDLVLRRFPPAEVLAMILITRDGLTHTHALEVAGIKTSRPDSVIENIEIRIGQAFERSSLDEFLKYVDYLR